MLQESAHETIDATNSSAPGKKFVVYQEVNFVSEKHSLVLYTSMKLTIFLCFVKLEPINQRMKPIMLPTAQHQARNL